MQSHPIKFKCGHEKALPLDERGEDLKAKIEMLKQQDCPVCTLQSLTFKAIYGARTR